MATTVNRKELTELDKAMVLANALKEMGFDLEEISLSQLVELKLMLQNKAAEFKNKAKNKKL